MILTGKRTRAALSLVLMVMVVSLEASCMRIGFERDKMKQQQPVEAGVPDLLDPDALGLDGPTGVGDGTSTDTGATDQGVQDAAVTMPDKSAPDAPVQVKDKGAPDTAEFIKDKGVPDTPVTVLKDLNVAIKDKSVGLDIKLATQACATSATQAALYPAGTMAVCSQTSGPASLNQCQAETLCNTSGGWHLCTASEYKARWGVTGTGMQAWIKGCIRTNNSLFAPTDQLCEPTCAYKTGKFMMTAWLCSMGTGSFDLPNVYVGLSKATSCWRVGIDDPSTGAYWSPLATSVPLDSALCCSP